MTHLGSIQEMLDKNTWHLFRTYLGHVQDMLNENIWHLFSTCQIQIFATYIGPDQDMIDTNILHLFNTIYEELGKFVFRIAWYLFLFVNQQDYLCVGWFQN